MRVLPPLLRNRVGPALLCGQVALTLAIVANAAGIAIDQLQRMQRPSGLDESNLLVVRVEPVSRAVIGDAATATDLQALKALPGVTAAARVNFMPLGDGGYRTGVDRKPFGASGPAPAHSALYFGDENVVATLGLRIVEGRGLTAADRGTLGEGLRSDVRVALITTALARALFPGESAIGRTVFTRTMPPVQIVGVIERLQSAWPALPLHEHSLLLPAQLRLYQAVYAVRTADGAADGVAAAIRPALLRNDAARIVGDVRPFAAVRSAAYRAERALALMLGALIVALLFITALGIGGTAAFWVASRTQQIGTRRALGARRGDIVQHFMLENFLITTAGVAAGSVLAHALNRWLVAQYGALPLDWTLVPAAVVLVYGLGQVAVLGPALRAAAVPPAVATRGA